MNLNTSLLLSPYKKNHNSTVNIWRLMSKKSALECQWRSETQPASTQRGPWEERGNKICNFTEKTKVRTLKYSHYCAEWTKRASQKRRPRGQSKRKGQERPQCFPESQTVIVQKRPKIVPKDIDSLWKNRT